MANRQPAAPHSAASSSSASAHHEAAGFPGLPGDPLRDPGPNTNTGQSLPPLTSQEQAPPSNDITTASTAMRLPALSQPPPAARLPSSVGGNMVHQGSGAMDFQQLLSFSPSNSSSAMPSAATSSMPLLQSPQQQPQLPPRQDRGASSIADQPRDFGHHQEQQRTGNPGLPRTLPSRSPMIAVTQQPTPSASQAPTAPSSCAMGSTTSILGHSGRTAPAAVSMAPPISRQPSSLPMPRASSAQSGSVSTSLASTVPLLGQLPSSSALQTQGTFTGSPQLVPATTATATTTATALDAALDTTSLVSLANVAQQQQQRERQQQQQPQQQQQQQQLTTSNGSMPTLSGKASAASHLAALQQQLLLGSLARARSQQQPSQQAAAQQQQQQPSQQAAGQQQQQQQQFHSVLTTPISQILAQRSQAPALQRLTQQQPQQQQQQQQPRQQLRPEAQQRQQQQQQQQPLQLAGEQRQSQTQQQKPHQQQSQAEGQGRLLLGSHLTPAMQLQHIMSMQGIAPVASGNRFITQVEVPDNILVTRAFTVTIHLWPGFPTKPKLTGFSTNGSLFSMPSEGDATLFFDLEGRDEGVLVQVGFFHRGSPFGRVRLSGNSISSVRVLDAKLGPNRSEPYRLQVLLAVDATLGMRKSISCTSQVTLKHVTQAPNGTNALLRVIAEDRYKHARHIVFHGKNWKRARGDNNPSKRAHTEVPETQGNLDQGLPLLPKTTSAVSAAPSGDQTPYSPSHSS